MTDTQTANFKVELLDDGRVAFRPQNYLGAKRFREYREACKDGGATYDRAHKTQVIAGDGALDVVTQLERRGFTVEIDPRLNGMIAYRQMAQESRTETADDVAAQAADRAALAGMKLYPFQLEGVEWLATRDRALLADQMGLGKSAEILSALPRSAPVVVVCPASLKHNWQDEIAKWRPVFNVSILKGRKSFRWPRRGEIVILNYDILPAAKKHGRGWIMHPDLGEPPEGTVLVADESHYLKGQTRKRTIKFRALSKGILRRGGRVWLATGTPIKNRPVDLWSLLCAASLELEAFTSWPEFVRLFDGHRGRFGYEWGDPHPSVKDRLRKVMLRRMRADVLPQLPRKTYKRITIEGIDDDTRNACDETMRMLAEAGIELTEATLDADLRHDHRLFNKLAAARAALAASKIPALVELVEMYEESEEPLIVFSDHRAPIDLLGEREGWEKIVGGMSAADRMDVVRRFQAGEIKHGVALTIGAGSTGLTLTRASHVAMCSLGWAPSDNAQAEDRVCRISQEADAVIVTHLYADHELDRKVNDLLLAKQRTIDASLPINRPTGNEVPETGNEVASNEAQE